MTIRDDRARLYDTNEPRASARAAFAGQRRRRTAHGHFAGHGVNGGACGGRRHACGAMLLEVIVSIGLLVFGMVMVGLQVNAGLDAARTSDIGTRAVMLADTKLAELDAGILLPDEYEEELRGDFGILYPGYTWRVQLELTDIDDFYMVTLEIGYDASQVKDQIDDPDYEIDFDDEGRRTVRTVYRLCPKPADVDLGRDFGLSDEEMDRVFELLDGGGGGSEDGSGLGLGLEGEADLAGMSDLLRDLLAMSDTGSFDPRLLAQLPEEDFMMLAGMLESMFGRGGADAVREQIGNFLPGGGGPRPGGGGRPLSGEGRPEAGERPGRGDRRDPNVPADQRIPRRRSDRKERPDGGSR